MIVELHGERVFVGTGNVTWPGGADAAAPASAAAPAAGNTPAVGSGVRGTADASGGEVSGTPARDGGSDVSSSGGTGDDAGDSAGGGGADPATADRPVLLLLHGAGMDRTVWVLLARYFARHGWNVVAPDWPAHGGSGGAPLASIEAQASWAWELVDALRADHGLGVGPLVAAGHSMGALAAVAMAGARPDGVARLLLLGAGYPMVVGAPLMDAARENARAAIDMITVYGHAHASRLGRNTMAGISVVNQAAALIARAAPGVLHADLAACHAWQGAEDAAERFGPGRTTILAGDEDRMTPARGTRNLASLLDAHVVTLDDCGHMMMGEQPETTLVGMRSALATLY